jgi:hypothetical protein
MGGNLARVQNPAGRNAKVICRLAISDIQKRASPRCRAGSALLRCRYPKVEVKVQRIARNGRISIKRSGFAPPVRRRGHIMGSLFHAGPQFRSGSKLNLRFEPKKCEKKAAVRSAAPGGEASRAKDRFRVKI